MAISPVVLNGMISRTQDVTTIKQNEDQKAGIDQNNFQNQFRKQVDDHMEKVQKGDDAQMEQKKYDAKDKGGGKYDGDGGRGRKKHEEKKGGKVAVKGNSSFDMKV